jgi:hypothetical protein
MKGEGYFRFNDLPRIRRAGAGDVDEKVPARAGSTRSCSTADRVQVHLFEGLHTPRGQIHKGPAFDLLYFTGYDLRQLPLRAASASRANYDDRFRGIYGSRHVVLMHRDDIDRFGLAEGRAVTLMTAVSLDLRAIAPSRSPPSRSRVRPPRSEGRSLPLRSTSPIPIRCRSKRR